MDSPQVTARYPVLTVTSDGVLCGGLHDCAVPSLGTHDLLRPAFLFTEIGHDTQIREGDEILRYDDGSLKHRPKDRPAGSV